MRYFVLNHEIAVVRLHVGGDFYSAAYARGWRRVIGGLPQTRFFCFTRSWRDQCIRRVLIAMARLANCRLWFSCDRQTGLPAHRPGRVRLAWLMTDAEDRPPAAVHLTFRTRALRRRPLTRVQGVRVCPEEDGVVRRSRVTCDRCRLCWKPLDGDPGLPRESSGG